MYNNGNIYEYSNVSRRAILSVMTNDKQSLGKWVNHNCKTKGVDCEWIGHESPWMSQNEIEELLETQIGWALLLTIDIQSASCYNT